MKLSIKEIAWGIDRMNGGYKERVTANVTVPCVVGDLPDFTNGRRKFSIEEVSENQIVLCLVYENNPSANKRWTIHKGEETAYMPRSFDGGYKYRFKVR